MPGQISRPNWGFHLSKSRTTMETSRTSFIGNGSLWFAHTAFLPAGGSPTHSAIQWYQMNPAFGITQFGRIEDTTATNFYAFPSIAVNRFNDVLVGFSRFASTQYVSANYAFRAFNDPQNTMQTERAFKGGEDSYWKRGNGL